MRLAKETAGAIGLLLLGAGLMAPLWISTAAANSSHRHGFRSGAATWRQTALPRNRFAHFPRLRPEEVSIAQLNPHLRGNDGHLAESLITAPSPATTPLLNSYGLPVFEDVPPIAYLRSYPYRRRFRYR